MLTTSTAGDFFREIALLEAYRHTATVPAAEDAECLLMTHRDLMAELRSRPASPEKLWSHTGLAGRPRHQPRCA